MNECQKYISSAEFAEWMAYYHLEPFGFHANFLQAGIIASTIANANRKKGAKPFKPNDFIPKSQYEILGIPKDSMEKIKEFFTGIASVKNKRGKDG